MRHKAKRLKWLMPEIKTFFNMNTCLEPNSQKNKNMNPKF